MTVPKGEAAGVPRLCGTEEPACSCSLSVAHHQCASGHLAAPC